MISVCFSVDLLKNGGRLEGNTSRCTEGHLVRPAEVLASQKRAVAWEIRSFTPHSGWTAGSTPVEIIADGIDLSSDVLCHFGAFGGRARRGGGFWPTLVAPSC